MSDQPCPDQQVLEQLLLGRIPADQAAEYEEHFSGCESCAERAGQINSEDDLIVAMRAKQLPPEGDSRITELIERLRNVNAEAETSRIGDTQPGTGFRSGTALSELSELLDPPVQPDELGRIGQYRVLDVLDVGGMGIVLRAEDPQLKRLVAIKVMKGDVAADESAKSRFLREAQATAKIEHDNIVTIYQVAEHRGLPYYAMQFLRGESLEDRLRCEGNVEQSEVLRIGREIAEGLTAAHAEGLLHRDIKPDNIWLEENTGRAKIVDFGLARDTKDDQNITHSGMVLGTPRYMAPEQALGTAVDQRCDLFSLGSVMYHLATGQPPFAAENLAATLMAVVNKQPQPVAELQPEIGDELVHLIDRLLVKDPVSRCQSAVEVVDAIRQVEQKLEDHTRRQKEEVRSEPSFGELHLRDQRRRRVMIRAALGTLLLAIVFGVIFFIQTQTGMVRVEVNDESLEVLIDEEKITVTDKKWKGKKKTAKHRLAIKLGDETLNIGKSTVFEVEGREVEHHLTVKLNGFDVSSDEFSVLRGDNTVLEISLERKTAKLATPLKQSAVADSMPIQAVAPDSGSAEQLSSSIDPIPSPMNSPPGKWREIAVLRGHEDEVNRLVFSPTKPQLATIATDGTARIWDLESGETIQEIKTSSGRFDWALDWSPDGKKLAIYAGGDPPVVKLWDIERGEFEDKPLGLGNIAVDFSPDGKLAALALGDELCMVEVVSRKVLWTGKTENIRNFGALCVRFSPNGKRLLTGGGAQVGVWDAATGKPLDSWFAGVRTVPISDIAFSPGGSRVAIAIDDGPLASLDATNGKLRYRIDHPEDRKGVLSVSYSPDGRYIASAGHPTIRVREADTGADVAELRGHESLIRSVAFSPDGKLLASCGRDKTVRLWKVPPPEILTPDDGWVDLLAGVDVTLNADPNGGSWRINDVELVGIYGLALPVIPVGSYEWEIEFTPVLGSGPLLNFTFPHEYGRAYVAVIGKAGIHDWHPAGSRKFSRVIKAAPAVSHGEKHILKIKLVTQDDTTSIAATIDGKPWAEWSGKAKSLASDSLGSRYPAVWSSSQLTIHASRLRMLDGEARWDFDVLPDPAPATPAPE